MARMFTQGMEIAPGFKLVKLLGRGGFGEVWKASAPGGTDVAIKIISLGERYGFKEFRAVQLVKQIHHPNLVPIIAFWLTNEEGKFFQDIVGDNTMARKAMELELIIAMGLGDKNLLDRLRECQKEGKPGIPPDELLGYMEDSARAIDYLNQPIHDLGDGIGGINHCDIKPQNILIVGGAAQVCDFGLARVLGDTRVTSAKGSAAYMAPEMITENKPQRTTDQYFLAISYVELRTGALPFSVASPAAAIWAHVQGKLDLSKLSPPEQEVIRKAAAVNPDERYPTTVDMVRALRQALAGGATPKSGSRIIKLDELIRPGGEIVPGYKLNRLLGKGGYGQVWEATAPGGKKVALKIIRNLEGVHGRQEFKALELIKGVDHNHLMELHAYWLLDRQGNIIPDELRDRPDAPEPSTLVIASKLANKNLLQRLDECLAGRQPGIPLPELLAYMKQAAQAIDYLNAPRHQLGPRRVSIQHRDIKPENILLAADVVKVGDFGLAKVVEGSSAVIHGDSAGLTLAYAAPEMFTSLVTSWTDQYCLALTYFKLRTGSWPFPEGSTPNEIIKSHVLGKLDLGRLPEVERLVIARATAVKPENRYPSCSLMVEELERACFPPPPREGSVPSVPPPSREPTPPSREPTPPSFKSLPPAAPTPSPEATPFEAGIGSRADSVDTLTPPEAFPSDTAGLTPTPPSSAGAPPREPPPSADETLTFLSQRPPTVEKIKVKTREQVELPPESIRPQPKPAADLDGSRSPVRTPVPSWKEARKSVEAEPAAERKAPESGVGVQIMIGVLLAVGVAAVGLYAAWDRWRFLDRSVAIQAEVQALLDQHQFAEARARAHAWGVRPEAASSLDQRIRHAWLDHARAQLTQLHAYDQAAQSAANLLGIFPGDADGQHLLESAQRARDIQSDIHATQDFPRLDAQLDASTNLLDEGIRAHLRAELLQTWLKQARQELFEDKNFARARQSAADLNRANDTPTTRKLLLQATLAGDVQALIEQQRHDAADRKLELAGTELDDRLRTALRGDVLRHWLDQARVEFQEKKYERAARTTRDLLARFPDNPDALALRKDSSRELLADARKAFVEGQALLKNDRPHGEKLLEAAIVAAQNAQSHYGVDDPQGFLIIGKANELLDRPVDAMAAYEAGLPYPNKAGLDKLSLLIGRLEFQLNPQFAGYRQQLGYDRLFHINRVLEAADRAVELASTPADADAKARALALSALARSYCLAHFKTLAPETIRDYRDEVITRLRTALALKPEQADAWKWRLELAEQLDIFRLGVPDQAEKDKLRREAIQLLREAGLSAPAAENKNRILPLLKRLEEK